MVLKPGNEELVLTDEWGRGVIESSYGVAVAHRTLNPTTRVRISV